MSVFSVILYDRSPWTWLLSQGVTVVSGPDGSLGACLVSQRWPQQISARGANQVLALWSPVAKRKWRFAFETPVRSALQSVVHSTQVGEMSKSDRRTCSPGRKRSPLCGRGRSTLEGMFPAKEEDQQDGSSLWGPARFWLKRWWNYFVRFSWAVRDLDLSGDGVFVSSQVIYTDALLSRSPQ